VMSGCLVHGNAATRRRERTIGPLNHRVMPTYRSRCCAGSGDVLVCK
jgi:hypothetical protein